MFQSTHPRGVRHNTSWLAIALSCFNPRTHVGCDNFIARRNECISSFNPRTHVGCDEDTPDAVRDAIEFQSTHPRGVRRVSGQQKKTPSWFQSTHPRGVRLAKSTARPTRKKFQSTHPRGVRLFIDQAKNDYNGVSIHAPTWGATVQILHRFYTCHRFNPRTHVGCDSVLFISPQRYWSFNPRTHVGCDITPSRTSPPPHLVSIHAPTWGAT